MNKNKSGEKEAKQQEVKRPAIRSKKVDDIPKEEEKNLSIYCRPSKVVKVNVFLKTHVDKDKQKSREDYIKNSSFGFLLDLAINDPSKNEVMGLVRKRWNGEDIVATADQLRKLYGGVRFGQKPIVMDIEWGDKEKWEFKDKLGQMGITPSDHLFVKIKQLELALKTNEKAALNDKQWAQIYILYALSVFLLGSTTNVICGKYWQYLVPLAQARNYDWMEHIAARANAEFIRASDALRCGTHIKIGGNSHALLNASVSIPCSPKTREVPSVASKLPVRRMKSTDKYHNMSLQQLYENFHKLHLEREDVDKKNHKLRMVREAVDKKIEVVKDRIAERKKTAEQKSEGSPDDVKDQDDLEDLEEDNENELEHEVEEDIHDDDHGYQHDEATEPQGNDNEPEVEEGINAEDERPDVIEGKPLHDPGTDVDEVRAESKRKMSLSVNDDAVETTNKKVKTTIEDGKICTPWDDTQFVMEVNKFVDEVVKSAFKPKPAEIHRDSTTEITEELRCARPIRTVKLGPQARTPFQVEPQKKYSKRKKDKKLVEDLDFQITDQRPTGFVSAPPRENQRDYLVTNEKSEVARMCYASMTLDQKKIVLHYAMDTKIRKDLPGELLVFDKSSYLLREDAITLRPRQWVSSIVPEFYARAKARQVHNCNLPIDRIVFSGQTGHLMMSLTEPDLATQENREFWSELGLRTRKAIAEHYPYVMPYLKDIPYLMVPHCDNKHFTVYVIDISSKACFILDSWKNIGKEMLSDLIYRGCAIQTYLAPFTIEFMGTDINDFDWKLLETCPKQEDNYSCGVFASMFLKCFSSDWAADKLEKFGWTDTLESLREDICRDIVINPDNLLLPEVLRKALKWFDKLPKTTKAAKLKKTMKKI